MVRLHIIFAVFLLISNYLFSQKEKSVNLDEIILSSNRIEVPFSENSRTIQVISNEDIQNSTANNVAEILQQFTGVDIRRRGVNGMQSDLYIRGGSFEQTLVLIDGIKTENPQTGHHTMNIMIPVENIERIEIIKGPAARIYGQNAFTGAINIVTKKHIDTQLKGELAYGSYHTGTVALTGGLSLKESSHMVHISQNSSDGYRYNTDFKNRNIFLKSKFNTSGSSVDIIATFMDRKFGANGFYASPEAKDQYEETQSSLIGISTNFYKNDFVFKPKIYWKRGQDMYEFIRGKPEIYRNLHITNKIGGEFSTTYSSKIGITGFGVDIAQVFIRSNNLGDHERTMVTGFLEHRFKLFNDRFDVTPGVALTYYSDFDFQAFPGIDLGYIIHNKVKIYANMGYTFRIPTYTDLYYNSPTTIGNIELKPEEALSEEFGIRFSTNNLIINTAVFYRDSRNLIDYVKENEEDKWQAVNLTEVTTKGFETEAQFKFNFLKFGQKVHVGYTFLDENILDQEIPFSRYSLNSIKHQITVNFDSQFLKYLRQNLAFRFVERPDGTSYNVVDFKLTAMYKELEFSGMFNNFFNTEYTETNLVPMPGSNVLFSLKYTFK